MNAETIKNYFQSIEAWKAGDKVGAESYLAASLGLKELTPILKSSLPQVLDPENPNPAIAHLIAHILINNEE